MQRLLKNRVVYLSTSFVLLLGSFPLISIGTTEGPEFLWWLGLLALSVGAMIPPAQRLLFPPKEKSEQP
ncbi:MAG TPA: hypothetical protein VNS12_07460 [Pelagibacterium sp.]|nr:hypothetical protein [Pelagibacterium sp.]